MKILVVEDDDQIGALVSRLLEDEGHSVSTAVTGSAALAAAIQTEYDLLICDLMLPDLQGTEIVRALKAQSPRLPVVVISALEADEWAQQCEDAGATRFFQKPLDIDALLDEVRLVAKARLDLHIAIVDSDPIHATRLNKMLTALGCEVTTYDSVAQAKDGVSDGTAGLLVIDADLSGADELIRWGKGLSITAFAFCAKLEDIDEDELMRAGAAFILTKPIDVDALLTQASFMVG